VDTQKYKEEIDKNEGHYTPFTLNIYKSFYFLIFALIKVLIINKFILENNKLIFDREKSVKWKEEYL